ncbi:MAG: signal recognition particle-docking protein FtsY [Eubacterium sp.]|nr:signal recognition particle-docking protein FtsY [Eubacterium sp.]
MLENSIEDDTAAVEASAEPAEETPKKGWFARLKSGLNKTRDNLVYGLESVFGGYSAIDDDFYDDIEEILITGDMGVVTTENILDDLRDKVKELHLKEPSECRQVLIDSIIEQMGTADADYVFENEKSVILVTGVNGVGKTTTIGKLAAKLHASGRKVVLAAGDTFRAAAAEQLQVWAQRSGAELISGAEGADPASVVYDACQAAKARGADVLIVDTAGRLHNKKNLMDELGKISRILDKELPEFHRESLVVVDAATGQNALNQAKEFSEVADVTGVVLTKMDGSAKGGIAVAIQAQLSIPVKYIGVGESTEDLQKFDSKSFVEALFDTKEN